MSALSGLSTVTVAVYVIFTLGVSCMHAFPFIVFVVLLLGLTLPSQSPEGLFKSVHHVRSCAHATWRLIFTGLYTPILQAQDTQLACCQAAHWLGATHRERCAGACLHELRGCF